MPPHAVAKSPVFRSAVEGEWSETMQSMVPSASASHRRSWLADSRMGGQHLNSVAPSGTSSAVRVRKCGQDSNRDPHALGLGGGDERQRVGGGQVQYVDARVQPLRLVDQVLDRGVLGVLGAGGQEVGVLGAGVLRRGLQVVRVLGVHDHQAAEAGDLGERGGEPLLVELRELLHAGGRQEALEAEDAGVVQRPQVLDVVGQRAAPEADVHVRLGARDVLLHDQVGGRGGRRQRVQRHVEDGGDATGRGGPGGRPEAFPLGTTGVVHVDVGVDQAGEEHVVAEVLQPGTGRYVGLVRQHGRDLPAGDGHRSGARPLGGDDARRAQYQFHSQVGHRNLPIYFHRAKFNVLLTESSRRCGTSQERPDGPLTRPYRNWMFPQDGIKISLCRM
ncbi:hypothetical protein SAVIM338S_05842 [Streptomyces avidinii]